MIRNLIFDFGRVLITYDYDRFLTTIVSDPEERAIFKSIAHSRELISQFDKGDVPREELILDLRRKYPEWEKQIEDFYQREMEAFNGEIPGMRELLKRLKKEGFRIYGLTNWGTDIYRIMDRYDILKMPDDRLISSEEHLIKPEVEIYRRICEKFSLVPEECLFTDDKIQNVEGARSIGMHSIQFVDAIQFEKELTEYLQNQNQ